MLQCTTKGKLNQGIQSQLAVDDNVKFLQRGAIEKETVQGSENCLSTNRHLHPSKELYFEQDKKGERTTGLFPHTNLVQAGISTCNHLHLDMSSDMTPRIFFFFLEIQFYVLRTSLCYTIRR